MKFRFNECWESPQGILWWVTQVAEFGPVSVESGAGVEYVTLGKLTRKASRIEVPAHATKGWRRVWSREDEAQYQVSRADFMRLTNMRDAAIEGRGPRLEWIREGGAR